MKRLSLFSFLLSLALLVQAQIVDPVHFSSKLNMLQGDEAEIVFSATIDPGWHVYSTDLGQDGPIEATLTVVKMEGVELIGKLSPRGNLVKQFDNMFGMELKFFEEMCMPPTQVPFQESGKFALKYAEKQKEVAETEKNKVEATSGVVSEQGKEQTDTAASKQEEKIPIVTDLKDYSYIQNQLWKPIVDDLKAFEEGGSNDTTSWWMIFLEGLLGGFLAILTPCVWPIIPMTVSFFLKRNKERSKAIREALTYGASIVVIYVVLGLLVTLLFGASALNALSTNAVFNIFFALLLIVFAASFFGAFELTLPSSWSNKIDQKSESTTGLLSIFLMAFTLALVFALFPSLLKSAPKSGGWMNTVKVVLGFIELAFALKFLSVADLAYGWHLLDREVFVSLWIVMFTLLGCYLLGWLKFPHDDDSHRTNVPQFFLGMVSMAFAVYMVPGLWGAPLKAISAFAPPMNTQDFNLYTGSVEAKYKDYDLGMAAARAEGKPVMVDFTGFGCVNCRKMEAAVWTAPKVQDILNNRYVLISLYVDDKTPLAQPIEVTETDGQKRTLRTVGDKWSYLQRTKIGANTQPYYVLLDPTTGKPLNGLRSYDEDIDEYIEFLVKGLENFK